MAIYLIANGAMQTTAKFVAVTTGTSIKTLLQVKAGATIVARLIEWGISFDGFTPATPIAVECIETDVAATVTASVANDISKQDADALSGGDPTTALISVGTAATGYTASAEGTITAVRNLDAPQYITNTVSPFVKQFGLGNEPIIQAGKFGRIRVHAPAAVNAYCYMVVRV